MDEYPSPIPAPPIRVLVVARHPVARAGLRGLLGELGDANVVGVLSTPDDSAEVAEQLTADVVLAGYDRGDADAISDLAESLVTPGIPLVLFGDAPPPNELTAILRAGARGFLLADAAAEDVGAALRAAARGLLVLTPVVARALPIMTPAAQPDLRVDELTGEQPLTDREREVLQLLSLGLPNKTIARRLGVSEHTVKFHVGSILAKLDVSSRTEAVTTAARRGLLAL
jgi:DNA-binding NarL/FixJ family response regulator